MPEYIVRAQWNARVRNAPNGGDIVARLKDGSVIKGDEAENGWVRVPLSVGGVEAITKDGKPMVAYLSMEVLERVGAPPPPPPPPHVSVGRVGLLCMHGKKENVERALALGCKFLVIMDNKDYAIQVAESHPDVWVGSRMWFERRIPSVEEFTGRQPMHPRIVCMGVNEGDQLGQDGDGLKRRAEWDLNMNREVRARGGQFAAGGLSMGTPDFTKPSECDIVRQAYADAWNSGEIRFWNHHLYSPSMGFGPAPRSLQPDSQMVREKVGKGEYMASWVAHSSVEKGYPGNNTWIDPMWFETRWRFLYTHCGFSPSAPGRIMSDETGVDQGGIGGFPQHGATDADVKRWVTWFLGEQAKPLVVDGREYASPFVGGAIFQVGAGSQWAGYDMSPYMDALKEVW